MSKKTFFCSYVKKNVLMSKNAISSAERRDVFNNVGRNMSFDAVL